MVTQLLWPKKIRSRLILGFGAILLLGCISSAIGYGSLQRLRTTSQSSLESAARVRELSLELQVSFLQVRKAERTYMREWRTANFDQRADEYIETSNASLNQARENLRALQNITDNPELLRAFNRLDALFNNYASAFEATTRQVTEVGSGYGLYQDLQTTLQALSQEVTLLEDALIQQLLWDLVGDGQAYFNTGNQQYISDIRSSLEQLTGAIAARTTSSSDLPLKTLAQDYIDTLDKLLRLNQHIQVNLIISENINQEIDRLIVDISQISEAQTDAARQELARTARQTSFALLSTSITALGLTVWASFRLGRRIIQPLTILSRTAESIAQGNLDQTVQLSGEDEFSTVATAFNKMVAQLRQSLTNLEQQVSDRTQALATTNQALQDQTHFLELALHKLQRSEADYRQLIENLHAGVLVYDAEGRILLGNHTAWELIGVSAIAMTHSCPLEMVDELKNPVLPENHPAQQVITSQTPLQNFIVGVRRPSEETWTWILVNAFPSFENENGDRVLSQVVVTFVDISDRKLAEEELRYQAMHDSLTGLPNRTLFAQHLDHALQRLRRHANSLFAVLFIDLDRFKIINDSLGHLVGDQLLIQVAAILKRHVRTSDMVARLGGDEFVVLLEQIDSLTEAIQVAERIQADTRLPIELANHTVFTSASIGIALGNPKYTAGEDILRDADNAMYQAKAQGKARHTVFDPAMHQSAIRLFELETSLRKAIERQEFTLHYQPIVSLEAQQLLGFEALVRWIHPIRGLVPPSEFIPITEETGLIVSLSKWIFQTACHQMALWQQQFPHAHHLKINVNIAADQFKDANFLEFLDQTLMQTGLSPSSLKLEITESLLLEEVDQVLSTLLELQQRGIEISIDDFGTGYSSLIYLKRFPINTLKIDKSFVDGLGHEYEDPSIVKAIIQIAQSLKMSVVAEGVETFRQQERLRQLGCNAIQGYLIARPLPPQQATDYIQSALTSQPPEN